MEKPPEAPQQPGGDEVALLVMVVIVLVMWLVLTGVAVGLTRSCYVP